MRILKLTVLTLLLSASSAFACSNPTGTGGEIIFNIDHKVMQFCDGDTWKAMGSRGSSGSTTRTPLLPPLDMPDIITCLYSGNPMYFYKSFTETVSTRYDNAANGYVYYTHSTGAKAGATAEGASACPANIADVHSKYNLGSSSGGSGGGGSTPTGAIMAFDLATCPTGWSVYTAAQGRFLRGIDPAGTVDPSGARVAGHVQADAFQGHAHGIGGAASSSGSYGQLSAQSPSVPSGLPIEVSGYGAPRIASETRPKNVAVLYCRKD